MAGGVMAGATDIGDGRCAHGRWDGRSAADDAAKLDGAGGGDGQEWRRHAAQPQPPSMRPLGVTASGGATAVDPTLAALLLSRRLGATLTTTLFTTTRVGARADARRPAPAALPNGAPARSAGAQLPGAQLPGAQLRGAVAGRAVAERAAAGRAAARRAVAGRATCEPGPCLRCRRRPCRRHAPMGMPASIVSSSTGANGLALMRSALAVTMTVAVAPTLTQGASGLALPSAMPTALTAACTNGALPAPPGYPSSSSPSPSAPTSPPSPPSPIPPRYA